MKLYLDQSIRIEQTNKDTIIGLADQPGKHAYTLCIPSRVKRQVQEIYRRQGQPKRFMVDLFSAGIILALKSSKLQTNSLTIDIEYPGHEIAIMNMIQAHIKDPLDISFTVIGKHSFAHYVAYGVHIRKRKPDHTAKLTQLLTILKQKDRGL